MKPSKPQAIPAINMAGWPFRMAGQRVQPAKPPQPWPAQHQPDESQHGSAERSRLPHGAECMGRCRCAWACRTPGAPLVHDVGHRGVVRAHKIVDRDEGAVARLLTR